ncbi:MAG: carboxypeptidase-like regulatory domain-containing protein [Chitinophagaceae bacterium]|nr:carboxypeptidase-like regulatory domain-containing protein [Chitinophagaceae bacterium]
MKTILSIILFFISITLSAQSSFLIKGKVLDDSTGTPLDGASVLCQNTTKGTMTDKEGAFKMDLPSGGHLLVITYTGYETESIRISSSQDNSNDIVVKLKKKEKKMEEVVIQATTEVKDGWNKYGKQFRDYFLGSTPNAQQCIITNPDSLHFYFSKKRNRLKVKAEEPVVIMNYALGYKIQYRLDSFIYDYTTKFSTYTGNAFYTEIDSAAEQKQTWKKNREQAYYGSRLHFMRCYYDSTLSDNGYILEQIKTDSATGKFNFIKLEQPYDSSVYTLVDSVDKEVTLFGKYRLTYQHASMEKEYLTANKYPLTSKYQVSTLEFINGFGISENGFFYEQTEVINSGYWAWKILGDQLPYDYWPESP